MPAGHASFFQFLPRSRRRIKNLKKVPGERKSPCVIRKYCTPTYYVVHSIVKGGEETFYRPPLPHKFSTRLESGKREPPPSRKLRLTRGEGTADKHQEERLEVEFSSRCLLKCRDSVSYLGNTVSYCGYTFS